MTNAWPHVECDGRGVDRCWGFTCLGLVVVPSVGTAECIPGLERPGDLCSRWRSKEAGASVDLGLVYDPKRELVFAVLCHLEPGAVRALRLDGRTLKRIEP